MKRTTTIVLAVSIALSMTACDALDAILQVNLFAPFAAVSADEMQTATSDELLELAGSTSFFETLAGDEGTKTTVLETIDKAMEAAEPSSPEYQELAALGAQIELQTTPAGDLINNVSSLLGGFLSGSAGGSGEGDTDLGDLIAGLVPASVLSDDGAINQTAFVDMINSLVAANTYFEQLGNAIGTGGYADGADISAGDVAQSALVAALVGGIEPPAAFTGDTGQYLYALLTDPDGTPPLDEEFAMPDMTSGYLANLLAAANLNFGDPAAE